jgi:hypothetical protein
MKNIIYFSFCLLFISCSVSRNIELKVVNDFIKEEFNLEQSYKVLVKEASSRNLPLEYYERAFLDKDSLIDPHKVRIEPLGKRPYLWPIDAVEIKLLKERNKNDTITYQWKRKDFVEKKFRIIEKKKIKSPSIAYYKNTEYIMSIIKISKPIVTSNGKFALLHYTYYAFSLNEGNSTVILMENVNGRWKKIGMYALAHY